MPTAPTVLEQQLNRIEQRLAALEMPRPLSATVVNDIRQLNTVFQIGAPGLALVIYALRMEATSAVISGQESTVRLLTDANNPPTTERGRAYLSTVQTLGAVKIGQQVIQNQHLIAVIQHGHYIFLESVGTGTVTVRSAVELVLG